MMSGSLAYKNASMLSGAPSQTDCSKRRYSWSRCEYHRVLLASFPANLQLSFFVRRALYLIFSDLAISTSRLP